MKLLVVEDNARLGTVVAEILRGGGLAVDVACTIADAQERLHTPDYDLILLDLTLPDGDGATLLRDLRRRGVQTPVLVTTARGDVADRVAMLNAGADDYLVKPFSLEELLARARALLRRPPQTARHVLALGNVRLDTTSVQCMIGDAPFEITRLEFRILASLLAHPGELVARPRLEQAVYESDAEVMPNAMEVAISRLRRRLNSAGADIAITAMRGLGYAATPRPAA